VGDLQRAAEPGNLSRAWRWIKSNPEATYKSYCRNLYTAYAVADEVALADLRDRLRRGVYEPSHATKIYFPKSSGILRPYSILTVEDQIVYQSMVNIIAERLHRRVKGRYLNEVFGHLYGGKTSAFFYRRWTNGYAKLNEACRKAFNDGHVHGASFDLTACYDSLDHGVLRHFLRQLGCDEEFNLRLTDFLSRWTATNHRIYHNHGIPQGPLASGLLSEVVLRHFDEHRGSARQVRYVRYVDDIRLFAKSSDSLRRMLVRLDTLSKDIGLFPQSSKVHIHRIKDIEDELKSLSNPPEPVLKAKVVNQERLRSRIVELSPHFRVEESTRFKYMLACAEPSSKLNDRMWRIYENQPEFYGNILRYFQRYARLPQKVADRLLKEIDSTPLYHAVHAEMLATAEGRLDEHSQTRLDRIAKKQWTPKTLTPELQVALGRIAIRRGLLTYAQTKYAVQSLPDWWARSQLFCELTPEFIGEPSVESLLNFSMRNDEEDDVCMMAAHAVEQLGVKVQPPARELNRRAAVVAREYGHISRASERVCGIEHTMVHLLGKTLTGINWRSFFGSRYRHAERQAVSCRALADTNVTAFVPALDVFIDLLLDSLYRRDTSLGGYTLGHIGSVLGSTRLQSSYPSIFVLANTIHAKRLESELAHPVVRKTGKPTGRINYSFLTIAKVLLRAACLEIKVHF
jgi:hypothetical protein